MTLLLDSNVWIAAFTTHGLCADLVRLALRFHRQSTFEPLLCPTIREEIVRVLTDKFGATDDDLAAVRTVLSWAKVIPDGNWTPTVEFSNPQDATIVGAGLAAGAELLVTGDKAVLALRRIGSIEVVTPREAFTRLRGLSS